ncbi:hypothetical protein [Acinetobacter terrae]|nr:hypothetical protein [Acinetobacter terrae]
MMFSIQVKYRIQQNEIHLGYGLDIILYPTIWIIQLTGRVF